MVIHRAGERDLEIERHGNQVWWRWLNNATGTGTGYIAQEATWTRWTMTPHVTSITYAMPQTWRGAWTTGVEAAPVEVAPMEAYTFPVPPDMMEAYTFPVPPDMDAVRGTLVQGLAPVAHAARQVAHAAPEMGEAVRADIERMRAAERDRRQRAREEYNAQHLAEQARLTGAQDRAMGLLLALLTPEEREYHATHDEFLVIGHSGRRYLIGKHGVHGNIAEVDEHGCRLGRVCVAPGMYDRQANLYLPLADGWVGQYLAIKHNEEELRRVGNWSGLHPCRRPEPYTAVAA
jgi:hypothetical protein